MKSTSSAYDEHYRHEFDLLKPVNDYSWSAFTKDMDTVLKARSDIRVDCLDGNLVKSARAIMYWPLIWDGDSCVGDFIGFNGHTDFGEGADPFVLGQEHQAMTECKTSGKPYDWFVVASLILINHHSPESYAITCSSGACDDWSLVASQLSDILEKSVHVPAAFRGKSYQPRSLSLGISDEDSPSDSYF